MRSVRRTGHDDDARRHARRRGCRRSSASRSSCFRCSSRQRRRDREGAGAERRGSRRRPAGGRHLVHAGQPRARGRRAPRDRRCATPTRWRTGEQLNLRVAQLPFQDGRSLGRPAARCRSSRSRRHGSRSSSSRRRRSTCIAPLAGLLIDEWVEVVPSASETTAMVFQFDQPDAAPPQSLLLAVPPDLGPGWTLWTLQQVLLETLDLARLRVVDPEALIVSRPLSAGGVFRRQRTPATRCRPTSRRWRSDVRRGAPHDIDHHLAAARAADAATPT